MEWLLFSIFNSIIIHVIVHFPVQQKIQEKEEMIITKFSLKIRGKLDENLDFELLLFSFGSFIEISDHTEPPATIPNNSNKRPPPAQRRLRRVFRLHFKFLQVQQLIHISADQNQTNDLTSYHSPLFSFSFRLLVVVYIVTNN